MRGTGRLNWRVTWWWLLTLPFGMTTWAAFLYPGLRLKRKGLIRIAILYAAGLVVGLVLAGSGSKGTVAGMGSAVVLVTWLGGIIHGTLRWRPISEQLALIDSSGIQHAQELLARREYGRQLLKANPSLAREVGIGRPELQGADSFGLVDVNRAERDGLLFLPGLNSEHAQRIIQYRNSGGVFVSAEDLVMYLDLPLTAAGPLRDVGVFDVDP